MKIAYIDPASFTLPYNFYYILQISKYSIVDYYCSKSRVNFKYVSDLCSNESLNFLSYLL